MNFGYDIKQLARAQADRGLTNDALGRLAKVHATTVKNVMAGRSGTPTTISKLATAMDLSVKDLVLTRPQTDDVGEVIV